MTTFVLIAWLSGYYGKAIATQEFADKAACENAMAAIRAEVIRRQDSFDLRTVCVPKGTL